MADMNPVVHFEMPAEDKQRMRDFYSKAFGWTSNQLGADMGDYVVVMTAESDPSDPAGRPKNPGSINGGFYTKAKEDPMRSRTSLVIGVADIQESMKKVTEAGGTIHGEPTDIPGVGRYVSFTDPEGNPMSTLQPLMAKEGGK